MQTAELQFVLRNCFSTEELRRVLRTVSPSEDPYEAAVEAILNEDEDGLSVLDELDRASLKQRRKVRSMSAKELRSGVAFEFMERGRTLGHTVWALMRDDRISAKTMADALVQQFDEPIEPEEVIVATIEVNDLLSDLNASKGPEIDLTAPQLVEIEEPAVPEQSAQDILSEEEISREVDSLIDSLKEDVSLDLIDEEDDDDGEIIFESFALENTDDETPAITDEDDILQDDLIFDEDDIEALNQELEEELTTESDEPDEDKITPEFMGVPLEDEDDADADDDGDIIQTLEDVDSLIASFQDHEESPSDDDDQSFGSNDSDLPLEFDENIRVELGGVPIPLSALQQACERVFQEPVELVVDETLTRNDKIVVVGKKCGVRVLQGPSCAISAPEDDFVPSDAPVRVSPSSLQAALSTIHGESVEIVPDSRLLSRGIVVFAGRSIGIGMYEHPKMQVLVDENGAVTEPDQTSEETADLMGRIHLLEERLSALESAPPVMIEPEPEPIVEEEVEPAPEPEPTPESEPEPKDSLSEETISLDEIESEELSPVAEDINEDELMAAIALQDDDEDDLDIDLVEMEENIEQETDDGSSGDALDLGEIEGLLGGETEKTEEKLETVDEDELEIDGKPGEEELNLDELDLGSFGLEVDEDDEIAEAEDETETAEADDSEDEDALDLSELDLGEDESLELDESDLGDLDIDMEEEDDDDDGSIGDALDLDVLSELDGGNEDAFTPHKVLNGEKILLLGGKSENSDDYLRIVQELGGSAEWHGELNGMGAEEISELVNQCDLILTLTSDALSDPGILQAVNYAQENNKRLFEHHSANPVSVQKQLVKLVEDGKV